MHSCYTVSNLVPGRSATLKHSHQQIKKSTFLTNILICCQIAVDSKE